MHSCCTDYARNLYGKRPVRSRNRNCMMYSPTDFADDADFTIIRFFVPQISQIYTDLDLFGLWGDADFSSSNTQKKSV